MTKCLSKNRGRAYNLDYTSLHYKKFLLLLLLFNLLSVPLFAQKVIRGKVTDNDGVLIGAGVSVKNGTATASTDTLGRFSINAPENGILIFSYVGYVSQEIKINGQTEINVRLVAANSELNQVVIIGYGTARRQDVASAVNIVKAKDAGANTATNPSALLIGKAAGVQVLQSSGTPGADAQIIVRGTGSFTSVEPLYVIDGIQGNKDLFNSLSSQDIDNLTILKDASSTAIYGAAAANGVVIVTTKKGKSGAPSISLLSQWGVAKAWKQLDLLNAAQYVDAVKDYLVTNNATLPPKFSTPDVLVDRTDWQKEIFRTALSSENHLNIMGGGQKSVYTASVGYISQKATIKDYDNNRLNARLSLEETFGRFKLGQTLNLRYTISNGLLANTLWANGYPPYKSIYDDAVQGGYSIVTNANDRSDVRNPLQEIELRENKIKDFLFLPQFFAEVNIIKGLRFRSQLSITMGNFRTEGYQFPFLSSNELVNTRQATRSYGDQSYYTLENYFSYDKRIGKHAISLTAGNSYLNPGNSSRADLLGSNLSNDNIHSVSISPSQSVLGSNYDYTRPSVISYFGRIMYNFDDKYILTASLRRDGASNFGKNNRFGNFPGIGVGWNFSNEDFVKNALPFLSEGKLRIGWGRTGNNNIPNFLINPFTFAGNPTGNIVYPLGTSESNLTGITVNSLSNPSLKWEQTDQTDIGLDFSLLKSKLSVTVDWYKRKSSGLLVNVLIPSSTGIGTSGTQSGKTINAADAQNTGFEFQLGYNDKVGTDFRFNVSVNAAFNKNKVLSLGEEFNSPISGGSLERLTSYTRTAVGSPIGSFYGYRLGKVASTKAEVDALDTAAAAKTGVSGTKYQDGLLPGDFVFKDLNGDGVVTEADQEFLGNAIPKVVYGLNASINYKNFDLNIVFSGVGGLKLLNATKQNTLVMVNVHNGTTDLLNRWRKEGDVAALPRLGQNATASGNLRPSDWWLESGNYIRLRNLTLGYTIDKSLLSGIAKGAFKSIRVFAAAQNLFTITKYTGYDPEVSANGSNIFDRGIDNGQVPQPRTFLAGVQLGF